jgi:hypothetical protein
VRAVGAGWRPAAFSLFVLGLLISGPVEEVQAQACRLLTPEEVEWLVPTPAAVRGLQQVLATAYPATTGGGAFVDGQVGSNTVDMTQRLCLDLGLDREPGDVGSQVLAGAEALGEVMTSIPDWRTRLDSPDFVAWASALPRGTRTPYYIIGPSGPRPPTSALLLPDHTPTGGVFLISDSTLALLASPPEVVGYRITGSSVARLRAGGAPATLIEAVEALTQLPATTTREGAAILLDTAFVVAAAAQEAAAMAAAAATPIERLARDEPVEGLERFTALVDIEEVLPSGALSGGTVSDSMLVALERLKGIRFPNAYLFRQALETEVGIGASRPGIRSRIMAAALVRSTAPGERTVQPKPIHWDGGCGCGTFVKDSDEYPTYLYGMYPFWNAPQQADSTDLEAGPAQAVDFTLLTRVAYNALTFDSLGVVGDPLHWRTGSFGGEGLFRFRSHFERFVATAHRHKTDVDLVVANDDWQGWLPPPGGSWSDPDSATVRRNRAAFQRLIREATGLISPRLGSLLDRLKPWIALGQSPRRTLGDGITLDLDFRGVAPEDQLQLFVMVRDQFLPKLRDSLDAAQGKPGLLRDLSRDYALNLVVPGYCLSTAWSRRDQADCAFYTGSRLAELERLVDLILVDFSKEPSVAGAWARRPTDLDLFRGLQQGLDDLSVEEEVRLRAKIIPLIRPGDGAAAFQATEDGLQYGAWNFSGTGLWSVPVDSVVNHAVARALNQQTELRTTQLQRGSGPQLWQWLSGAVGGVLGQAPDQLGSESRVERAICGFACPNRWLLQGTVLLGLLVLGALWIASNWWPSLRKYQGGLWVPVVTIFFGFVFMTSLWCDPYWSERRSHILLIFLGGLLLSSVLAWFRKRREAEYP